MQNNLTQHNKLWPQDLKEDERLQVLYTNNVQNQTIVESHAVFLIILHAKIDKKCLKTLAKLLVFLANMAQKNRSL